MYISLNDISLNIQENAIFSNLSITLLPSAIIHLTGPNGSGKTSLLRMISNLQQPSNGCINICDHNNQFNVTELEKPYCIYIGNNLAIKEELTVKENIYMWSTYYNNELLVPTAIHYFQLEDLLNTACYKLSMGNKKKLALTRLIICNTSIWLLDEIYDNLDEQNKLLLNNLIITKANNGGIVIITHHGDTGIESTINIDISEWKGKICDN